MINNITTEKSSGAKAAEGVKHAIDAFENINWMHNINYIVFIGIKVNIPSFYLAQ